MSRATEAACSDLYLAGLFEWADSVVVRVYASRGLTATTTDAVIRHATTVGTATIHDRLVRAGERSDRRLASYLTGSAFVVAVSGFSVSRPNSGGAAIEYFAAAAAILGTAAFLSALRGTTRRVGATLLTHEADEKDIVVGVALLRAKEAWGWISARALLVSVVILGVLSVARAGLA